MTSTIWGDVVANVVGDNAVVSDKYTLTDKLWQYLQDYAAKHRAKGNGFGFGLGVGTTIGLDLCLFSQQCLKIDAQGVLLVNDTVITFFPTHAPPPLLLFNTVSSRVA